MKKSCYMIAWAALLIVALPCRLTAEETGKQYTVPLAEAYSGNKYLQAEVEGMSVRFIFDTGCSSVSISRSVFNTLLRRGLVKKKDLSHESEVELANGTSHKVKHFVIKHLRVGDCVLHNVHATVSMDASSEGGSLFGQAALERMAYYSVAGNTLYFESKPEGEQHALYLAELLSDDTARVQQQRIVDALQPYAEWLTPRYLLIYAYALYRTGEYEQAIGIFRYLIDSGVFEDNDRQLRKALEKIGE